MSEQAHWEEVYRERQPQQVSWYEPAPETSLALIKQAGLSGETPIIDVGAGTSALAAYLLGVGYSDVTVAAQAHRRPLTHATLTRTTR